MREGWQTWEKATAWKGSRVCAEGTIGEAEDQSRMEMGADKQAIHGDTKETKEHWSPLGSQNNRL